MKVKEKVEFHIDEQENFYYLGIDMFVRKKEDDCACEIKYIYIYFFK